MKNQKLNFKNTSAIIVILALALTAALVLKQHNYDRLTSIDSELLTGSDWQQNYDYLIRSGHEQLTYNDYLRFTENTPYYDYDNYLIAYAANKIRLSSHSSSEAIINTLKYVYEKTSYSVDESSSVCLESTAPKILSSGSGQCDTQSIAVIAILRKLGIAAKPVGGCVYSKPNTFLQSFLMNSFSPMKSPKYVVAEEGAISLDRKANGGLHAWVVAYVPGEGWVPLEPTAGSLAPTNLYVYHVELFPADNNKEGICSSDDYDYAKACYDANLLALNNYGLGLMDEVSVE